MAVSAVYLSALRLWTPLYRLGRAVAGRDICICIAARRWTGPFVAEGAHSKRALGHGSGRRIAIVLRQSAVVPNLGGARLLRVQGGGEGIDLALELGDAAVGLLLALSRRRRGDAVGRQSHARTCQQRRSWPTMAARPWHISCRTRRGAPGRSAPSALCTSRMRAGA